MVFCIVLELIQMRYNANYEAWRDERWRSDAVAQIERLREELTEQLEAERERRCTAEAEAKAAQAADARPSSPTYQPIIMGSTVYLMMPVEGVDPAAMRAFVEGQAPGAPLLRAPIEVEAEVEDVSPDEKDAKA